jgi:hypothetical protein
VVGSDELRDRLTIREAATLLGVHPNTVRNRIKDGTYEAEKILTDSGPTYYVSRESLLNNVASQPRPRDSQQSAPLVSEEAEAALQELLPSLVSLVGELETSREADAEKEKRESLRQGAIEYWKSFHDFYKHLTTLSLAAIAAFGALLGGVFADKPWRVDSLEPTVIAWMVASRENLIFATLLSFGIPALAGMMAMRFARRCLYDIGKQQTVDELTNYQFEHTRFGSPATTYAISTIGPLMLGIFEILIFILASVAGT